MDSDELRGGLPVRLFEDQATFDSWLLAEPRSSKGIWLRLSKKGSGLMSLSKSQAVDAALCNGWIDGQLDKYDEASWLVRCTPRKRRSKWSEVNRTRVQELIRLGRVNAHGLAEVEAAKADGRWEAAYAPPSRAEVPTDLQTALDRVPVASAFFATLTGADRYAILYRIATVTRAETRARRIDQFVAMLGRGDTIRSSKS